MQLFLSAGIAVESKTEKKPEPKYPYPAVPKNMGWNWNAEDIPGLKVHRFFLSTPYICLSACLSVYIKRKT